MSESVSKIAAALLAAQKEIEGVSKNSENPHFKSKFADLTAVIEATIPVLNKHGISVIQLPAAPQREGELALSTLLLHESGESISGVAYVPLAKSDPQAYGSAMTYARRYSLGSAVGLKFIDDDAEAAVGRGSLPSVQKEAARPARLLPEDPPKAGFFGAKKPAAPVKTAVAPKRSKTSIFPKVQQQETVPNANDETEFQEADIPF